MNSPTLLCDYVNVSSFLQRATVATTSLQIEELLKELPIVSEDEYTFHEDDPAANWQNGKFHWIPVGRDRGNSGRIKQANLPVNPIAERAINGMEALIEMERQRELLLNPKSIAPISPRDAVQRYFRLPSLDQLPKLEDGKESKETRGRARELARQLRVRLIYEKVSKEFTVSIEDSGIGQPPSLIHKTLLSLGTTTKADKWYLIGVFGQGGSSAYAVSNYSWLLSRRAPDLLNGETDGAGWTIVKHVFPKGRRDDYFAYLACTPEGHVPFVTPEMADGAGISHGTKFVHVGYDFGRGGSAITRQLYATLNHVLYNPILPLDLYVGTTVATVYGNGYRLSNVQKPSLDKLFPAQTVSAHKGAAQ